MQFQQHFGLAAVVLFTTNSLGCIHSQPLPELKPDEKSGNTTINATLSPASTPEITSLPPDARQIPVSDGVILGLAIQKAQPVYPLEAQAKGILGEVKIRVSINQEGHLAEATAISGHPLLQAAALTAVKQWRWRPQMYDGPPLYAQGTLTFHFPPRT